MADLNHKDLELLKDKTKLNQELIRTYFKQFTEKYPKGRINKKEFINEIVFKLIIEDTPNGNEDLAKRSLEKIKLSERLFDICDQDESGKVDFIEVSSINMNFNYDKFIR